MADIQYLYRRLRSERRLARRARSAEASDAHRQLADMYADQIAALGGGGGNKFWLSRGWWLSCFRR